MYYDYLYWHCSAQLPVSGLPTTLCHAMRSVEQKTQCSDMFNVSSYKMNYDLQGDFLTGVLLANN